MILIPVLILYAFSFFNLWGIHKSLLLIHGVFFIISLGIYFLIRKIGSNFFRQNASLIYWIFVALLAVTYIVGFEARGSKRWIDLYLFNFQPSEFFKIFFVMYFAQYFSNTRRDAEEPGVFFRSLLYFAIPVFIIFKQPDLGSALVYTFSYVVMLYFSYIPKRTILTTALILVLMLPLGWTFLKGYQKARVISFVNPHVDRQGIGYNMLQAVITTGSGGFFGRGMGQGTQTKLLFLPENHTDFAFASLIEQFGFLGGLIVIGSYMSIVVIVVRRIMDVLIEDRHQDFAQALFQIGFLSFFVFQVLVNISMNMGLFPITGITLPFISYGGSSLAGMMISLALLP